MGVYLYGIEIMGNEFGGLTINSDWSV